MPVKQEPKAATKRLIRAVSHPLVNILGHPTARLINRRAGLDPDMAAVAAAAAEGNTALEINANPMRLDLRDIHAKLAIEAGCMISINTDAHAAEQFDLLRFGIMTAQRGWVTADRCINTWTNARLLKWIAAGR
jgi:DNA polymerase (family 10)